ncbi:MAG TPA: endonuclease domain-containing protein [Burkholderiales bacterium]|nr:endonuclease domain-containing protein [Burkholderiales bacterium]
MLVIGYAVTLSPQGRGAKFWEFYKSFIMTNDLTPLARRLRRNMTDVERLLWRQLRAHRFSDYKFRRQHQIGSFIVDFACMDAKLIIELDGGQHAEQSKKDEVRDAWLLSQGYRVLRFWNNDVIQNLEGVLQRIAEALPPEPKT